MARIKAVGSVKAAKELDISRTYVWAIMAGKKPVTASLAEQLGFDVVCVKRT